MVDGCSRRPVRAAVVLAVVEGVVGNSDSCVAVGDNRRSSGGSSCDCRSAVEGAVALPPPAVVVVVVFGVGGVHRCTAKLHTTRNSTVSTPTTHIVVVVVVAVVAVAVVDMSGL
jgi:hypothetical protein